MRLNPAIQTALVATNSISQGEQVAPLWQTLFNQGAIINFAHQTFQWSNDAKGNAAVHCIIAGFALFDKSEKRIFEYADIKGESNETAATSINGYLVNAPSVFISSRSKPPAGVPELVKGSQPTDGGNLILSPEEKDELIAHEPLAAKYIRQYMGGAEFINNKLRFCLWLKDAAPSDIRSMPLVQKRLDAVRTARIASPTPSVQEFAAYPTLFTQDRQPTTSYLAIPEVSSERRKYIPVGYLSKDIVASNQLQIIRQPSLYLFGLLTSRTYVAWMRTVAGRLKSDYRHSPSVFYSFPQPEITSAQKTEIETLAQAVLDARAQFPDSSLADLYDPLTMPPIIAKAHTTLDRAVDRLYSKTLFSSDVERVGMLFEKYQVWTTE